MPPVGFEPTISAGERPQALKTTELKFYKITDVSTLMYAVNN